MAPIRRSAALRPLSSEHHDVLLLAFRAKNAAQGRPAAGSNGSAQDVAREVVAAFAGEIAAHFELEERAFADALGPAFAEAMVRLGSEHRSLASLVKALEDPEDPALPTTLARFASALDDHVRWEERELFGQVEAALDPGSLQALGAVLEDGAAARTCARPVADSG